MSTIWNTIFYQPIYNTLIFIIGKITLGDVGFAIIILTIIVKLILFPLTRKSIKTQIMMRRMEPELKEIRKNYPDREEQAKKTLELYKKYDTNPFSGFLVILIQIPVIFALYYAFYKGLSLGSGPLYSFVHSPLILNNNFLGLINLQTKSVILALIAGVTQFIQGYFATPINVKVTPADGVEQPKTFQDQLADSMQTNVRYILPLFITLIAWRISAAVALYWVVSNIFTIGQEWYVRTKVQ